MLINTSTRAFRPFTGGTFFTFTAASVKYGSRLLQGAFNQTGRILNALRHLNESDVLSFKSFDRHVLIGCHNNTYSPFYIIGSQSIFDSAATVCFYFNINTHVATLVL